MTKETPKNKQRLTVDSSQSTVNSQQSSIEYFFTLSPQPVACR
ncbi:hypothetical protein [Nostoc linckia]|jgi:hypothetical protein|nr:hypothetical protein [Nostoc linckia]